MAYGLQPLAAGSFGGALNTTAGAGGGVIVDPSRPDLPGYRWTTQPAGGPYGSTAWGGGGSVARSAAGGLLADADADSGVIRINAWWSGAPYLRLARIVDGVSTPVRGAYPVAVTTATRRNRCTNPSFEVDATGWVAGSNTTVSTLAAAAAPAGARIGRLTATAAGAVTTSVPVGLSTSGPTSLSLALRLSAAPSGALTITATWLVASPDSSGSTSTVTTTATIAAATLAGYVGAFVRTPVLVLTPPSAGVLQGTLSLSIAGMGAGATADVDAVLIEDGDSSDGVYYDGDVLTGAWSGAAGLSESTLAATLQVTDREAPLDVAVRYELSAPDQPTYRALSEPVTLASNDRTWVSHPTAGAPMIVNVARDPEQTYTLARGLFAVLGRPRPVAVTGNVRQAASGTHEMWVDTHAQRDRLLELLGDGLPLLLRAPSRLGHGPGEWISVGDVTVTPPGHGAWDSPATFKMPYQVVDAPASELAA